MSTPSKRRRTSPSTYVPVNGQKNPDAPRSIAAKRASYQSPTKASLARSNPDLLPKIADAQIRRESSPNRRQSLRDAVLGSRSENLAISNTSETADVHGNELGFQHPETKNTLPAAVIPSPTSTMAPEQPTRKNTLDVTASRSPLKMTQSSIYTPRQFRSVAQSKTPRIVPTLVHSTSKSENSSQGFQRTEEELPPTPVELGSDQRPYRPRGLASSSPGGGARKRVRTQDGAITSSPLKTRISLPKPSSIHNPLEIASGIDGEEDEEESNGLDNNESEDNLLKILQDQLQTLRADCTDLEELDTTLSKVNAKDCDWVKLDASLQVLLSSVSKPVDPLHPRLETHSLFTKHPMKFLTLFSPGNLVMSYQTWEKKVKGVDKFVYETTFAAPEPWPPNTLNLTFETTFDLKADTIEHIRFKKVGDALLSEELDKWIHAQLEDPVMGCDLATIVSGIGGYFEADVARARTFRRLSKTFPLIDRMLISGDDPATLSITKPAKLASSREEIPDLLPFLTKTHATFGSAFDLPKHKTRRSASSASTKEIMLVYELKMNWIGNPSKHTSIIVSGFTSDASQHARKMFNEIEPIKGIVSAVESVLDILGIGRNVQNNDETRLTETEDPSKGKGKARKSVARRMTDFN